MLAHKFTYFFQLIIEPVIFGPRNVITHRFDDGFIIVILIEKDSCAMINYVLQTLIHKPVLIIHLNQLTFKAFLDGSGGDRTEQQAQASINLSY